MRTIHATAVAIANRGVLLVGASGSGKSDLALRLIDRGATLIADDRVEVVVEEDRVWLSAPPQIAGLMEVRGVGLVRMPHVPAPAALVVDLMLEPERLPQPMMREVEGMALPLIAVRPFEETAAIKIEMAAVSWPREG